MKNKNISSLSDSVFRRRTGVKKETFTLMIKIIEEFEKENKKSRRPKKLTTEERLLMTLEYLREYRTYFHISQSYGISESTCYENIKEIENILIKSRKFSLPKKKEILTNENNIEVILIDATENHIERPKKNKENTIQKRKRNTP
jgi:hypothetical protein